MAFLSLLIALLIEQIRPLRPDNPVHSAVRLFATRAESWFNAGQRDHGRLAWVVVMAAMLLPTLFVYWIFTLLGPLGVLIFNVLIVYLTLGMRQYSHYFTSIQFALASGDETTARSLLADWTKQDTVMMDAREISRLAIEKALLTTHHRVFGVFFWFILPFGPAGAVFYRVAEYLARAWNEPDHLRNEAFGQFAQRAFYWIDWIPSRLTAVTFAVVGNFEDAIYAWRNFAHRWSDQATGIILAAGGGAIGARLGSPSEKAFTPPQTDAVAVEATGIEAESLPGEEPSVRTMHSTVGLVWRALLLWLLLLLLVSLTAWFA